MKKKAKQTDQVLTWVQGQGLSISPFFNVLNKRINYALHGGREQEATKKS